MFDLLLTLSLTVAPAGPLPISPPPMVLVQEEEEPEPIDPKLIEATIEELEKAFKKGTEVADRLAAIEDAAKVPHDDVAKALAVGLKDKDLEVVKMTLAVLGRMEVPRALKELVGFHKKDRRLKKDEELLAMTLKSIAFRGDPSTIDLLSSDIFTHANREVIKARIYGLARARTPEAVGALMDVMKSSGPQKVQPFMEDLRVALAVLTGADQGASQNRWISWWNDNKRDLEIAEVQPEIHKGLQRKWDAYWGTQRKPERGEKREERGKDPILP